MLFVFSRLLPNMLKLFRVQTALAAPFVTGSRETEYRTGGALSWD